MLENYKNFLGNLVKINKYFHKKHNTYQYQVNFRSKEISNTLQNLANFINKSFEAKLVIPITWNILRGIFDGDGCFVFLNNNNSLKFNITTCSIKLSNQIKDFLINNGYSPTITKSKNIYNINLYKKLELIRLFKDLYKGSDIYLIRKYQKLATFVEKSTIKNTLNSGKDTLLTLSEASNEERAETIIGAPTY